MTIPSGSADAERVNEQLLALEACESARKKGKKLLRQVQTAKLGEVHVKKPDVYSALMTKVEEALNNIRAACTNANLDMSRFTKEPGIRKVVENLDQLHKEAIVITSDGKDFLLSEDTVKLIGTIRKLKKDSKLPAGGVISFPLISSDTMAIILEYLKTGTAKITEENFISVFNAAELLDLEISPVEKSWSLKGLSINFAKSMRLEDFTEDHCNQLGFNLFANSLLASREPTTEELHNIPRHLAKYISYFILRYGISMEGEIAKMKSLGIKPTALLIHFETLKEGEIEPSTHTLPKILKAMPQLTDVILLNSTGSAQVLSEKVLETLAKSCLKLKKLQTCFFNFNTLSHGFPELRELLIRNNLTLTNKGLEPASLYPKLDRLGITDCSNVTDLLDTTEKGTSYSNLRHIHGAGSGISVERMGAIKEKYKLS